MKVTGFTFIRNAITYDYPIAEAILSVLPLCDEFVVAVGNSEDGTRELVAGLAPDKIRILDTVWDDSLREGGRVLAEETNKAFQAVAKDSVWAFYIQGDEVLHEQDLPKVREAMLRWKDDPQVDGLLFNYRHFYGSYDFLGDSLRWYRREIRVIRNDKSIYSYRDAQGFRKGDNQKLRVKPVDAWIHHYGWVKDPRAMQQKQESFNRYWHDDAWVEAHVAKAESFDYSQIDALSPFEGSHPAVMQARIAQQNWQFDHDPSFNHYRFKDRVKKWIEKLTGYLPGEYKNYTCI